MTTIVYRDGIMASDGAIHIGESRIESNCGKIFRMDDGSLCGISGDVLDCLKFLNYLNNKGKKLKLDGEILQVFPNGEIIIYSYGIKRVRSLDKDAPFIVLGTGSIPALGALYAGASAEEAIRIASYIDVYTNDKVFSEKL